MNKKKYSGWIALFAAMVFVVQAIQIPVFAATTVNTAEELSAAVNTTGEYELGASFSVNQLDIRADQIKINGNGHTLTSANTNMGQASMCNKLDGLHTTFENITLDGGNQAKTDTCLWIGRGSWIWNGVTVQNWNSTSSNNRGAVTAGKSQNDPGKLTIYNSIIKNNHQGIAIDNDDAVCTVYGAAVTDNTNSDIRITKGTLNLSDDEEQTKKTIGKLVVDGGILNISGNTEIFDLVINGGTVNITGNITSAEGITINPVSYTDGTVIAALSDEVNKDTILSKLNIEEKYQDVCTLNIEESSVVVNIEGDITVYDTNVDVDYAVNEGESNRVASGSLHAIDYKTPAEYLSDGIYIKAVRGQAHQHDYDENYEYVPGILDDKTYTRLLDANPDNALMVGLYYGFKTMKGKAWQDAALENDGQTWKNYIKNDFMPEAFDENGNKIKKVYLWIPWNEPDLQWNKNMAGFYQAYEYAYDAVKEFDARELVQGPEFTRYKYENLTAFLTYCRDNDCLPDVLSWHELEAYPLSAENHCNQIRNWMLDNGIEPMPIAITEYQGTGYDLTDEGRKNQGTYNPGLAVTYIAPMERAEKYGFIYGLQSAWGRGGGDPLFVADLGQMADIETGTMPTGMWYVYHAYKNLTGKKVGISLNRDYGMDAVAAYDSSSDKKSSTIIIGKWTEESKNLSINLKNIPENLIVNNKISVKAESIPETLAVPLYASPVLTDKEYKVTGGNAVVEVPIEGRSAIALTITPPSDREQKQVIGLNGAETTGDITVSTVDGILYAENGKTSSYKNDNPTGNEKTTSYKDSGDSIAFKTNVAEDGLYKFEGVHITGSDGGFMQCYADGEAFAVPQDLYAESEGQKQVNYGNLYLTKGEHEFLFRIVGFGKNEAGQGTKLSFKELSLTPVKTAENEAVVKFDMNCEDASMVQTSSSVIAGDKLGFIPAAERKNYQLLNWNTKEDGSGDIVTADTVINEDKTIYAQWKLSYSAKFLKNPNKIAELSVENNIASIKITLPANKTVTLYANNVDISEELTVSDGIASAQVPLTENVVFDYDITGPETISFDMSQSEEMTHGSAGFLYGISEIDVPSIDLLRGVKPVVTVQKAARGKQHPTADAVRVRSMLDSAGAYNIQVYLQDIYLEWPYDAPRNEDGTVDLDSYQKTVESILYDMICDPADKDTAGAFLGSDGNYYVLNETEAKRYSYVLFNEPDQIWFGKNVAGAHDIAAAWNKIYKAVKAIDPNAKCAGPNWAMFGADRMVAFLGDCKENNCLPEMITWHELDDNSRFWTWYERLHDRYIPEYYKDAGYTPEILVNEYVGYNYIGLTGKIMQQVQQFEDADIMGCMAYWGLANSMNEMAADRNSPTATWWLYHWYAQMTGSQKPCSSSEGLYGVTSYDEEANMAYTLFGGNTEQGGINRVSLENISNTDLVGEKGACHVKIYGTGYSGTMGADYSPELIYEGNITAKNDALRFEVKSTDEADIYFAVVTKTDEPGAEPEPAELSALSYEAENADILGNAVIQSRLSSSDFGVSGKKTVGNIVKNGDGVEFTVEVPNDGIYDASIFYAVQAPYVNPKTLVPDNNGQNRAIGKVLPFGMSVDGGAVLTLNFESTARWIYETQCHKDIYLTAGTHKIRYEHINGDESAKGNLQLTAVLDKLSLTPVKNESQRYNFTVEMKEMKGFRTGDTCEITAMAPVSGYYTLSGNADFTAEKLCVDYAPDAKSESVCSTNRYAIGKTVYLSQGANTLYIKDNGALDELKFTYEQEKTTNGTSVISADKLSIHGYVPFYKENEYAESGMVISELGVGQSSERGGEAKDNYAEFKVNVSSGGLYNLAIRYANDEPAPVMMTDGGSEYVHPYNLDLVERYAQIQINDNEPETVYFRNTLSWDVFRTMDIPVRLSAGENTVRIYNDNSYQISSLVNSTAPEIDTVSIAPLNYTGEEISIVSETTGEEIDASYLDRLISEAAQYMTEEYTDETVSELRAAIQAADRTSQSAVNKSCNNIENAIKQMKLKPAPMWGTYLFENNSVSEDGSKTLETVTSALAEGGSIVYSEGRDGKGVAFNGSYGLDLGIVGREFTVSAWVKADSQSGMTTIFFKNMGDKNSQHWVGITVPGGKATVWQHNGSSQKWNQVIKAENSSAGEWAMYTYTEKNGVGTLYVNDEKIGEFSNMLATDKASLYMGATFWTADALKGTADDLLISDKEFTADEVRELYNQSLPIVLNAVLKDGKVEYSVSGKTDYNIYVALYDDGGKLVSLKLNDMQDSFELPGKGKYTVKLMIWDNMKPSSDAQIVEIENLS